MLTLKMHYQYSLPYRFWNTYGIEYLLFTKNTLLIFLVTHGRERASIRYWLSHTKGHMSFCEECPHPASGTRWLRMAGRKTIEFSNPQTSGEQSNWVPLTLALLMGKINNSSQYWDALPGVPIFTPLRELLLTDDSYKRNVLLPQRQCIFLLSYNIPKL